MSLSYPLSLPASWKVRRATMRALSVVGSSASPFTLVPQTYAHQGERWAMDVQLAPLKETDAQDCIALLLALNGMEGSVLMPPARNPGVRGTWAGSPVVNGAHAAGVKTIAKRGFTAGATIKAGDWLQS